jgi:hypothetical protein
MHKKMKFYKIFQLFILIIFCFLLSNCVFLPKRETVRELELHIIDNDTNEPIPNISVFYHLDKVSPVFIVEVKYTTIDEKLLVSDENGKIIVPRRSFLFGPFQELLSESLYININFTEEYKKYYENYYGLEFDFDNQMTYYFVSYDNRDGVFFINQNYYPAVAHIFAVDGSYVKRQEENSGNRDKDLITYPLDFLLGNKEKQILTIKLIKNKEIKE